MIACIVVSSKMIIARELVQQPVNKTLTVASCGVQRINASMTHLGVGFKAQSGCIHSGQWKHRRCHLSI